MDQNLLESLTNRYKSIEGSNRFILACFIVFEDDQPKRLKSFITNLFTYNHVDECSVESIIRLSAHFWNIAKTKLDQDDYKGHIYSSVTSSKLRCIARFMAKNQE